MKTLIAFLMLFILGSYSTAQVRQLDGSASSLAGQANHPSVRNSGVGGQPLVGSSSGGNFGNGSGYGDILDSPHILLDVEILEGLLPTEYAFAQNYPNPFNPSTTFEFALPKAGSAKLVLYDILGREAAVVLDKSFAAGSYRIRFEASSQLASGLYFAAFDARDFHQIRKVMFVK